MIIKIDRKTIRKNPNAGRTVFYIPGKREVSPDGIVNFNIQTLYSLTPDPDYLFEYENPIIICKDCDAIVTYEELVYNDNCDLRQCPFCSAFFDEDVVYEKIEDVI